MSGSEKAITKSKDDDSDDPMVEIFKISGSECVKKSQIEKLDIKNMVVRCTTCLHQLNHYDHKALRKHKVLNVLVCKECSDFYGTGEFSQDESGNYNYCAWCGNGGKLFLCDFCPNVFCSTCVRRNFGRREVSLMSKEGWKCYRCTPKKLKAKVAFCNLILEYSANEKKRKDRKSTTDDLLKNDMGRLKCNETQSWILPVFDQFEESCQTFHRKLKKLKDIGISQSKSVKHVIKKMDEIVASHKSELGRTLKSLSNQYNMYIQNKLKAEEKLKKINAPENKCTSETNVNGSVKIDKSSDQEVINLVNNSESDEGIIHEPTDEKSTVKTKENASPCEVSESNNINDSNYKAKMSLLEESSVSSDADGEIKLENKLNGKTEKNSNISSNGPANVTCDIKSDSSYDEINAALDDDDIDENSDKEVKEDPDFDPTAKDVEVSKTKGDSESNVSSKAKKKTETVSMEPKGDSESNVSSKAKKETETVSVEPTPGKKEFFASDSSIELSSDNEKPKPKKSDNEKPKPKKYKGYQPKKPVDENDPKLKLRVNVALESCDHLLQDGKTTIPLPAEYKLADLDKEISNLCKLPKKIVKKEGIREKPKPASKKKKIPEVEKVDSSEGASSSSICLSSGDESEKEEEKKSKKPKVKDANKIAKEDLMASDSEESNSSDTSSEEMDEETAEETDEKTSKKKKKGKVNSDSSDDFVPRKKKKYDKLLSKRILSDDSGKENSKKQEDGKKSKKRKKAAISDDDDDSKSKKGSESERTTTSDSDSSRKQKKKKKRIKKRAASSSDSDGKKEKGTEESQNTPKKGRKDIKKILSKKDLAEETKEAQMVERERRKRVQERQKLYNVIQERVEGKEMVTQKLVLEIDPVSKEEIVEIHPDLIEKLKPHQVEGVKFMWECTIESIKELETGKGSGCILAHCMGLGKTLQVITFLHTCMTNPIVSKKIKTAMVICPYNTVLNWNREFEKWLEGVDGDDIIVHQMTIAKDNHTRLDILNYWQREGGVMIISYDIFRRLAGAKIPKLTKKNREKLHELLIDPGADIVICDEGHVLKNVKSAISVACAKIGTERRIVLTGTPLQNNLMEYHCMLSFVKPHLLGTPAEFRNRFVNPIMNGQYDDSNDHDVKRMKKRIHILHKLLGGCVQRCDYAALTKFLPPKHEYVISVKLTETQIKMYRWYLNNLSEAKKSLKIQGGTLFQDYNILRNLCTHPYIVHTSFQRAEQRRFLRGDDDEMEDFIADGSEEEESKSSSSSDREEVIKTHKTRSRAKEASESEKEEEEEEITKQWYHEFISDDDKNNPELSGKIVLLLDILKECEAIGDKVILFSQSLLTLDIIEDILEYVDSQPVSEEDKKRDVMCRWTKNIDYFRMDGTTSADFRKSFIDRFNQPTNDRARLFLVSTKAGGLGTNLVGANRVILMDASWNPSHDVQAIFRVYRFGQVKPVYIYRLLAQGAMEEKIYDRQVTKLSLSIRVVDEQQIDRHFNAAELAELYNFEPEVSRDRPTPMLPADTLLAEMLKKQKDWIVTYHEHDSLLEKGTEEDLTEEERQAAWTEYENEREGRAAISESIDIDDEIKEYLKEPDFGLADYVGTIIPPCKQIIEECIARLKLKFPNTNAPALRRKLLMMIHSLRSVYQEKHVKVLRMKQEYLARGSVPVVINKYLEEINVVLKDLGKHYENISQLVIADAKLAEQARMAQQMQQNPQMFAQPRAQFPGGQLPHFTMNRPGFSMPGVANNPKFVRMPTTNFPQVSMQQDMLHKEMLLRMLQQQNRQQYAAAPPQNAPVITEVVDKEEPEIARPVISKSTVVIEEVE